MSRRHASCPQGEFHEFLNGQISAGATVVSVIIDDVVEATDLEVKNMQPKSSLLGETLEYFRLQYSTVYNLHVEEVLFPPSH